jgi:hypothetical protein
MANLKIDLPPLQPCCLNLLDSLTATDERIKQAVMVDQGTTEWSDFRRLRITGMINLESLLYTVHFF